MKIEELDTPALLIDMDIMERNLTRVANYAREHSFRLRPHTKTHKTPALGRKQLDLGAAGLTVAKVGEAEVMLDAEPEDLLVAYPVIGANKLARLMQVAKRTRLTVSLDSTQTAAQLSEAAVSAGCRVGVLAEFDAGLHRVGVKPVDLENLASCIARLPGLEFEGIGFYPGHLKDANASMTGVSESIADACQSLRRAGLEPRLVSGGSTPTLFRSHEVEGMNEIRPGTYIFNDRNTVEVRACEWADCAVSILATVVSTAVEGQMIIDGGSKTFSSDRLATGGPGFGVVKEAPSALFHKMNEEHGYIGLERAERNFAVGDRVHVIPNHVCVAVNLHEQIYGVRSGVVEETWRVEARGKLQ